jgi:hypothetical protein
VYSISRDALKNAVLKTPEKYQEFGFTPPGTREISQRNSLGAPISPASAEPDSMTRKADDNLTSAIEALVAGFLKPRGPLGPIWGQADFCSQPVLDHGGAKCLILQQRKGGRVV